jgi:hypothetical protein
VKHGVNDDTDIEGGNGVLRNVCQDHDAAFLRTLALAVGGKSRFLVAPGRSGADNLDVDCPELLPRQGLADLPRPPADRRQRRGYCRSRSIACTPSPWWRPRSRY